MPISNPTGEIGRNSLFSRESPSHDKLIPKPKSTSGESLHLADVSPRDKPWDIHRRSAEIVTRLYRQIGYDQYADRIEECAKWLQFAITAAETGEFNFKLFSARFCRVRHCPICQWRKSLMWRARILKAMPKVIKDYPTARYIFLTLTVQNCPITELHRTINDMNKAWKRLIGRKNFPAIGFVKSLEVTRGKDGSAHPHFHCFLMVRASYFSTGYLSHQKWFKLWQDCLKGTHHVNPAGVSINTVKPKEGANIGEVDGLVWGICETLKYTVKEQDLIVDKDWLEELTKQMHGVRAVNTGGVLKNYMKEKAPDEGDLIHSSEESKEELKNAAKLIFDWATEVKRYALRNTR